MLLSGSGSGSLSLHIEDVDLDGATRPYPVLSAVVRPLSRESLLLAPGRAAELRITLGLDHSGVTLRGLWHGCQILSGNSRSGDPGQAVNESSIFLLLLLIAGPHSVK